jgi:hypothetical protein
LNESSAAAEITRFTLAINDMGDVSHVARLIADHDPHYNPLGPTSVPLPGVHEKQAAATLRRREEIASVLRGLPLRNVVETGLIVTYARPFTEGRGNGFPIEEDRFVPSTGLAFHRMMLKLRHQVQAHIDVSAPGGFQRTVSHSKQAGPWSVGTRGPRYLNAVELRQLAELADEITERLTVARDKARE